MASADKGGGPHPFASVSAGESLRFVDGKDPYCQVAGARRIGAPPLRLHRAIDAHPGFAQGKGREARASALRAPPDHFEHLADLDLGHGLGLIVPEHDLDPSASIAEEKGSPPPLCAGLS